MLDIIKSMYETIHLVMILAGFFFRGQTRGITLHSYSVCTLIK